MMKLYYASGYMFVSDAVAEIVMAYAQALADVGKSDLITIPVLSDEETRGEARLLIGPSSELFCAPSRPREADLGDESLLTQLSEKIALLQPSRPVVDPVAPDSFSSEF